MDGFGDLFQSIRHPKRAWVVFTGQTDLFWLRILRPGFRHCFILLWDGDNWLAFDPLCSHCELCILPCVDEQTDIPSLFDAAGMHVVPTVLRKPYGRPAPISIYSCVEAVKRIIGIHDFRILTPWQLFKYLSRNIKIEQEGA